MDDQLRASMAAIRSALAEDGRFVFETRNPLVRAWERRAPGNAVEIVDDYARLADLTIRDGVRFAFRRTGTPGR